MRTTQEQRDAILNMLQKDQWQQAIGAAQMLGFEGITATFFEDIIKTDGLHEGVIKAIAIYYDNDLNLKELISRVRGSTQETRPEPAKPAEPQENPLANLPTEVEDILSENGYYEETYNEPDQKDAECADDGYIHITRNGKRHAFYNGQGRGEFTEKDIPRFIKVVENAIRRSSTRKASQEVSA